ncbi:MAG: hypothetical protein AAFX99_23830 [Myxococcota bacterium]
MVLKYTFEGGRLCDCPVMALQSAQGQTCVLVAGKARHTLEAERPLRRFACDSALRVAELWPIPPQVTRYLRTQDPRLRAGAEHFARAAARKAQKALDADRWSSRYVARRQAAQAAALASSTGAAWVLARQTNQAAMLALQRGHRVRRVVIRGHQSDNLAWLLMRTVLHQTGFDPHHELNSRLAWLRAHQDDAVMLRCALVVWRALELPELEIAESYNRASVRR